MFFVCHTLAFTLKTRQRFLGSDCSDLKSLEDHLKTHDCLKITCVRRINIATS